MQILFVSPYIPSRIHVRPYNFIKALARRGHAITLVCSAGRDELEALDEMREICARVVTAHIGRAEMVWNALRALPGRLPFQAALNFSPRLLDLVRFEARSGRHEVAHVEHLRAAALGYGLLGLPAVLDSVDCISLLFERALRGSPTLKSRAMALLDLARTRAYEATYQAQYDRVLVSSPEDAWALRTLQEQRTKPALSGGEGNKEQRTEKREPRTENQELKTGNGVSISNLQSLISNPQSPISVIPNGVDLDYFAPQPIAREPATLVFSGKMSYHANTAAALFLAHEIMPLVWARRPDVRLVIAGSAPPPALVALAADRRIEVTGYLPDLRPAIARATVAVCPLRYGVGIQNKVLEAMALATPAVVARQAARAIHARDRHDLLLCEQPAEYASAILDLIEQPAWAAQLGAAGRRYVERHHDWNTAAARLEALYREAIGPMNGRVSRVVASRTHS